MCLCCGFIFRPFLRNAQRVFFWGIPAGSPLYFLKPQKNPDCSGLFFLSLVFSAELGFFSWSGRFLRFSQTLHFQFWLGSIFDTAGTNFFSLAINFFSLQINTKFSASSYIGMAS